MKILLLEAFFGGSHQQWAEGFQKHSAHEVKILSMPPKYWKWRMHASAIEFARKFEEMDFQPDLILVTDMMDLALFKALSKTSLPCFLYFHENQLTYPWSIKDDDIKQGRDNHYGFMNYTSALLADKVFFNSSYHRNSFLTALEAFLKIMPDKKNLDTVDQIRNKSAVLHLGMDLAPLASAKNSSNQIPIILWNHRWEYDKNPEEFFQALFTLKAKGFEFQVIVLGESYANAPAVFDKAREQLKEEIIHFGYAESRAAYDLLLTKADILPVSSKQDFFGGSIVEAIAAGCYPLLPDRLNYPALIPDLSHAQHLYKGELVQALESLLQKWKQMKSSDEIRRHVLQFDWKNIIATYDQVLNPLQ